MLILNFLIKTCHRIIKFGYLITCLVLVGYFSLGFVSSLGRLRRKSQIRGSDSVPQTRVGRIHRTTITTDLVMKRDVLESWFCACADSVQVGLSVHLEFIKSLCSDGILCI